MIRMSKTETALAKVCDDEFAGKYNGRVFLEDELSVATDGKILVELTTPERQTGGTMCLKSEAVAKLGARLSVTGKSIKADEHEVRVHLTGTSAVGQVIRDGLTTLVLELAVEGRYAYYDGAPPSYKKLLAHAEARTDCFEIAFDLDLLKKILDVFYAEGTKGARSVVLKVPKAPAKDGKPEPILVRPINGPKRDKLKALLSPICVEYALKGAKD